MGQRTGGEGLLLRQRQRHLRRQRRFDALQQQRREKMGAIPTITEGALKQFSLPAFNRFAKKYEPEEVIISEFEPGNSFYLIQSGEVQLVKCVNGTKKNLDILKPGEFFGKLLSYSV